MSSRVVNNNATIQTGARPTNKGNDETTKASGTPFAEQAFPSDRINFPAREVAQILRISAAHVWNLIKANEIIVPQENIQRTPSKTSILIPRASLVAMANDCQFPKQPPSASGNRSLPLSGRDNAGGSLTRC
jgi:predicted DNA-binding transcriptional regulator AlpA